MVRTLPAGPWWHSLPVSTRQSISSGGTWEPIVGYSRALRVGDHVSVSGTTAATPDGPVGGDDVGEQTRTCLTRIRAALIEAGATLEDVVRTRMFVTDISRWEEVGRVHAEFFGHVRPATTMVEVRALIEPDLLVEVEVDAIIQR
ncbi:RidA family protein [Kineococcus sp. NBC_00420]|uniref:RidA family protein n=1 Tax=Kineococcus sp. NBC_00420 TaxID=2903564 RepID=UPI003FA5C8DD